MKATKEFEKEKVKSPPVPGRKRGRPKKFGGVKNTGGGLPFFNPYGGKKKGE